MPCRIPRETPPVIGKGKYHSDLLKEMPAAGSRKRSGIVQPRLQPSAAEGAQRHTAGRPDVNNGAATRVLRGDFGCNGAHRPAWRQSGLDGVVSHNPRVRICASILARGWPKPPRRRPG
ncbi:hypothetical protein CHELA40_10962 [Chelatococcus asaccharovorans]|nr:hypothetical protein CHELA40_10962 [Chelatococcus asaccharovorans]CAH1685697.1 hypothetical protein CHELA17_64636 [Chelatococcus asaccharovorans]